MVVEGIISFMFDPTEVGPEVLSERVGVLTGVLRVRFPWFRLGLPSELSPSLCFFCFLVCLFVLGNECDTLEATDEVSETFDW